MAAVPPPQERRRPRPGSLERPVSGRLYRGTWLLVALPVLLAAFSVARPQPLGQQSLPPAFDAASATALARDLATHYPSRTPGSAGDAGAARWFHDQLHPYGFATTTQRFTARIPGRGLVRLANVYAVTAGGVSTSRAILVLAHRDDSGVGQGASDNASGTAALVELARAYATNVARPPKLNFPIVFLSTDAGTYGNIGAAEFTRSSPYARGAVAVLNLDAIGSAGTPRLELAGDTARSPAGSFVETVRQQLADQAGTEPARPSALRQLVDLGFPFSVYDQAPFVARGIPAVTITAAGDRPPASFTDTTDRLSGARIGQIGRAAQDVLDLLEQGIEVTGGSSSYVYLGSRVVRGWAIELVLIAALLPYLAATVDLFARCRRRRIRIAPALRSYRSRLAFWAWCGVLFGLFTALGAWPGGAARPPALSDVRWPTGALAGLAVLALLGWIVARDRLLPRRTIRPEEQLAGHVAALLALGVVALLVVATNPFALIFLLPSLHAWLWLPQATGRPLLRAALLVAGFAGPALLLWSFAGRYGLGFDAPWYIAHLFALGYAPPVALAIGLAWLAAAAQLAALAAGRYAPYPTAAERPPRGPLRELVRTIVLARRARRAPAAARRALEG